MWIVNRSDVYDLSLQKLFEHPLKEIAARAREKYTQRHSSLNFLSPPEETGPLEEVQDFDVEEVLGHPLAPFEAMLFFSKSLKEDHRASAALSLTRRLLEHPPNWALNFELKKQLQECFFQRMLEDNSAFVRAYAARVPLLEEAQLIEALKRENDDFVIGRILQNVSTEKKLLSTFIETHEEKITKLPFASTVFLLDERLSPEQRKHVGSKEIASCHPILKDFYELEARNSLPST